MTKKFKAERMTVLYLKVPTRVINDMMLIVKGNSYDKKREEIDKMVNRSFEDFIAKYKADKNKQLHATGKVSHKRDSDV